MENKDYDDDDDDDDEWNKNNEWPLKEIFCNCTRQEANNDEGWGKKWVEEDR